jgi:hypothetical protein
MIAMAMRMPYQRMARGPIWMAMAPGDANIGGKIARQVRFVQ